MRSPGAVFAALALLGALAVPAASQPAPQGSQPPRGVLPPQPGTSAPPPATPAATRAPAPSEPVAQDPPTAPARVAATVSEPIPSELVLGAPAYPGALFLGSFSAGQGQRYYLFGSSDSYPQVVAFYRQALKSRGSEVFDAPPIWSFDLGRFREETMAYPPSVVVRDHLWGGRQGYLHASGTEAQRYPTIIQIVPPPPGTRR